MAPGVLEPREAEVVRWIYEAYAERRLGVLAIAQALNAQGVPPPGGRWRPGQVAWAKTAVWAILRDPVYAGDLVWGRARYREVGRKRGKGPLPEAERVVARGAAPAIVSRELWQAAQRRDERRRFGVGRPWHRPYLLSGLVRCARCGRRFQAQRRVDGRASAYYLCGGYVASGRGFCPAPRIPAWYLEEAVLDGIQKRLDRMVDRAELARQIDELLAPAQPPEEAIRSLSAALAEADRKVEQLVAAVAAGPEDLPSVRAARDHLVDDLLSGLAHVRDLL